MQVTNSFAAYQLNNAVVFLGITIENALGERVNRGTDKKPDYQPKYTLHQLLDDKFRLPRPDPPQPVQSPLQSFVGQLMAYAQQPNSGVKMWQYVGPEPDQTQ